MKIDDVEGHIKELIEGLPVFHGTEIEHAFGEGRPCIGDHTDDELKGLLGNHQAACKSGLYIFTTEGGDVIYIGKATKNNLHDRVHGHIGTPKKLHDGWWEFPGASLRSNLASSELLQSIEKGRINLHVYTVSKPDLVSLIEVYLQTQYKIQNNQLPVFNKQIG